VLQLKRERNVMTDGELRHDEFPVILQQVDGDLYSKFFSVTFRFFTLCIFS